MLGIVFCDASSSDSHSCAEHVHQHSDSPLFLLPVALDQNVAVRQFHSSQRNRTGIQCWVHPYRYRAELRQSGWCWPGCCAPDCHGDSTQQDLPHNQNSPLHFKRSCSVSGTCPITICPIFTSCDYLASHGAHRTWYADEQRIRVESLILSVCSSDACAHVCAWVDFLTNTNLLALEASTLLLSADHGIILYSPV